MVTVIEYAAYGDSFILGWILIDYLANVILDKGESFTRIRFFRSRFVSRDKAIILSISQVVIAMAVSYYIVDWIFGQMTIFLPSIIPITLGTIGFFYAYILFGLPYNVTIKRALPAVIPVLLAIFVHYSPQIASALAAWIHL